MSKNRAAAQAVILEWIEKLIPGSPNTQYYKDMFASMDDRAFDKFMADLDSGETQLAIIAPNLSEHKLTVERNFKLAEELGHNFFERVWFTAPDGTRYLSPIKYPIVDMTLRRQAQLQEKKVSIPQDNASVDDLTGQPTGKSKGSKISFPEIQVLAALGLDQNLEEFLKCRGGDLVSFNAMNDSISKTGGVDLRQIEKLGGKVQATETLHAYLIGMHVQNTL